MAHDDQRIASPVTPPADLDRVVAGIGNGAFIALGGYHDYRQPMALVRSILRAGLRDLTVLAPSGSIDVDLLVAAGAIKRLIGGRVAFGMLGLAPSFRRAMERGALEFVEVDNVLIMRALESAYRRVPYLPARAVIGSELLRRAPGELFWVAQETFLRVFPMRPDVAIVHVPWADRAGNLQMRGEYFDVELLKAAQTCIVSTDEIVAGAVVERQAAITVPRYYRGSVRALIEIPYGAHPTSCYPHYVHDIRHLLEYVEAAEAGQVGRYLDRFVKGPGASHAAYLEAAGGVDALDRLRGLARRGAELVDTHGAAAWPAGERGEPVGA